MPSLVKGFVVVVVMLIWAAVGFYLWIPMLILASITYAVGFVTAAFFDDSRMKDFTEDFLDAASRMYPTGFRRIWHEATKSRSEAKKETADIGVPTMFFSLVVATLLALAAAS